MTRDHQATYLDFYGLKKDPFAIPDSYSPVGKRHEFLEQLIHLNQFSHLVLGVVAPKDYGKTTLYNLLAKQLEMQTDLILVKFSPKNSMKGIDLLQQIASAWQVEDVSPEREVLLRQLRSHNLARASIGLRHCILIDDAEILGKDALMTLHELTSGMPEDQAIGLTLFCKEGSVDLRVIFKPVDSVHLMYLTALSNKDVFGFIQDHFVAAGHKQALPFTPDDIEKIYIASGGIPGNIKTVTRNFMAEQAGDIKQVAAGVMPRLHVIAISGLVLVILGSLLFQVFSVDDESDKPGAEPIATVANPLSDNAVLQVESRQNENVEQVDSKKRSLDIAIGVDERADVTSASKLKPAEKSVSEATQPNTEIKTTVVQDTIIKESAAAKIPPPLTKDWLHSVDSGSYTIQLLGARTEKAALDFIGSQARSGDFRYHEIRYQGKSWFVVTYGLYASKNQALQAIGLLSEKLKKQEPWLRSIQSIIDSER